LADILSRARVSAIRILGDISPEKVKILQSADQIFISACASTICMIRLAGRCGAVAHPFVGVMGDERTYEQVIALRAVMTWMVLTADWAHLPHEF